LVANNIQVLPITPDQLNMIGSLPHHHRDSFDRLLAAQAFADRAAVVSGDDALDAYGVERAW
jgi:PIN domain nuclease of toxin-antitoxin system